MMVWTCGLKEGCGITLRPLFHRIPGPTEKYILLETRNRNTFAHETSINSERLQNRSIFSFFSLTPGMIVKKGYSVQSSAIFWVYFGCDIQKQYKNQAFCKKKKLYLSVCPCFAREWNTDMTWQSKLDPFSCIVVHGPKKRPTSLLWKGTTTE